jgi:hypothetical protein
LPSRIASTDKPDSGAWSTIAASSVSSWLAEAWLIPLDSTAAIKARLTLRMHSPVFL